MVDGEVCSCCPSSMRTGLRVIPISIYFQSGRHDMEPNVARSSPLSENNVN
jgi:hypothetical protein